MPERIQMSRSHPWRAEHPDAVIVDRRTKWGNPFRVVQARYDRMLGEYTYTVSAPIAPHIPFFAGEYEATRAAGYAVRLYRSHVLDRIHRGLLDVTELAGRDLACWCDLASPCHASVLLELANGGAS